jgi:hypothetical protein
VFSRALHKTEIVMYQQVMVRLQKCNTSHQTAHNKKRFFFDDQVYQVKALIYDWEEQYTDLIFSFCIEF